MRRDAFVVFLIFCAISPAYGKEYKSSFGFTVEIPEHWLVLTREELKENPDLFDFDKKKFGDIDKNLLKNVESKIKSGQVEIYFNRNTSDGSFADNINIVKEIGRIPENDTQLSGICNAFPKQLSSYFGRDITLYQCKLVSINNVKSLFLEFDGAVEGTRSIQYQIQKSPSIIIIVTVTCKNRVLDTIEKEFKKIVFSIKM